MNGFISIAPYYLRFTLSLEMTQEGRLFKKIVRLCLINPFLCHFEPDSCPESRYIGIRGMSGSRDNRARNLVL